MKEIIIPFTIFLLVLLIGLAGFYFVSPAGQVSALQAENNLLKSQLAEAQGNSIENVAAVIVAGMLGITALLLFGFFLVLCLLSGKKPVDFFLPSFPAVPEIPPLQKGGENRLVSATCYKDDSYAIQTPEVIQ